MSPRPLSMLAGLRGGPIDEEDEPEEALDATPPVRSVAQLCEAPIDHVRELRETVALGARRLRAEERRHEGTKADLARTKRVLKNLGASNFAARTKLAEYIDKAAIAQAEVKRLRRALARARRAASPRPSATPEPVRPPTLGEIADALTEVELHLDPCPF